MALSQKELKKILEQKRKDKTNISVTLDIQKINELKRLSRVHGLPLSAIIEVCIEVGLADTYINPIDKKTLKDGF